MTMDPRRFVPHREPFLLLDRVIAADATGAVAEALAPGAGMPATLILECLAQACACVGTCRAGGTPARGLLVSVREFRTSRMLAGGERLRIEARRVGGLGDAALFRATAMVGQDEVASAQLGFVLMPD